jgi:tetratricopeptide (TPR) repeat protein
MTLVLLVAVGLFGDNPGLLAGDEAFLQIDYPAAIERYTAALSGNENDAELYWRLARAYVCMGEVFEDSRRTLYCVKAAEYALKCIASDSTRSEGHTWRAAALGYVALDAGMGEQVELSRELLREVDRAIALNPSDDAAYSIKGSFYRALGNVGWFQRQLAKIFVGTVPDGTLEDAERALMRAITLAPDVMRHHYELGVLYLDMERREEARHVLAHAATLPVRVGIDRPRLKRIKELLKELGGE